MKKAIVVLFLIILIALVVVSVGSDLGADLRNRIQDSVQADPPSAGPPPVYPEIPASTIYVPLQVDLTSVETAVNRPGAVPTTLKSQAWTPLAVPVGLADITYTVSRGHIGLNMQGDALVTTVPVTIQAGARWGLVEGAKIPVYCNDIHLTVRFETNISLDENWQLQSESTPVPYTSPITCNVNIGLTHIPIDITAQARAGINEGQQAAAQLIDGRISSLVEARAFAESAWGALSQPIDLGQNGWLVLNPEQLQVGALAGSGKQLTLPIGVVTRPQLLIGSRPAATESPLPLMQAPDPAAGGFQVTIEVELPYETATAQMAGLIGSHYTVGGQTVIIDDIRIYGAGALAVIELTLSGDFNGIVYLTGTPKFDAEQEVVYLDDVDFDIHSRNLLVNTADWLFHEEMLAQVETLATWNVAPLLAQASEAAAAGLNRDLNGLRLSGQLNRIELLAILPSESAFQIIATAVGELSAIVSLPEP